MIADYTKDVAADWEQICFQTHMQLISVLPLLAFNCTWYLSAGADHITSGSSSCLCWRHIPLYAAHFPSCPSDSIECQLLGASGFCINYKSWDGYSESGADSISADGEVKEGELSPGRYSRGQWKDTGRWAKTDCKSPQDKLEEILEI